MGRDESRAENQDGSPESFLEIQQVDGGELSVVPLVSGRHLIGRNPDLSISLNDVSVSRLHATLVRDPYDRWWVHDLGSKNGTYVNGSPITQRFVNPGDAIQIGRYRLVIKRAEKSTEKPTVPPPPPSARDLAPSTSRIPVLTPARLNTALTLEAIECARGLLRFEDKLRRIDALCDSTVSERFPGVWAVVMRVERTGQPRLVAGPAVRFGQAEVRPGQEHWLAALCEQRRDELLQSSGPHVLKLYEGADDDLIGCVLSTFPEGVEILFVQLGRERDVAEWHSLLSLLATSFRYANELWETRGQLGVNAAVERELDMARQLQDSLIPRLPLVPGLDLAIGYEPSRWVSGDYADSVGMPDGRVLLTIADVCGKGLQAALVASSLHTLVHVLVDSCNLADMANQMNSYLCRYLPEHSFVTMVCVAVDVDNGELECINLGHPPPLLVGADGTVRTLQSGQNVALGMTSFVPQTARYSFDRDEVLFLYTDGLTEPDEAAHEKELPGRLAACVQIIASMAGESIEAMCQRLSRCVGADRGPLTAQDDAAFLVARLQVGPSPAAASVRGSSQTMIPIA